MIERVPYSGFNVSVIRYKGQLVTATRTGWAGANIHINGKTLYRLRRQEANYGREDPRLFIFRGRLHIAYVGVVFRRHKGIHTNICYARLTDDYDVEQTFAPIYPDRNVWEKNWAFFEAGGELYCVYSIYPEHKILRIDGNVAELAFSTPNEFQWSGGHRRGGASPVLHDGRYWHWFHGAIDLGPKWPTRRYNVGLYTFRAEPPFDILTHEPTPRYWANHSTRPKDQYCSVIFPCGAYRDGDVWRVSCGVHDRWGEVLTFK